MSFAFDRRSFLGGAAALAVVGAHAQTYPARPVRIIVPLAPASAVDIMARKLGEQLSRRMGQQFIIDNKPGAGGVIGTAEIVRAAPDGYTLGMISSNHVINPGIIKSIPFDSVRDIRAISVTVTIPCVMVVHPSLPVNSVADVIAMARTKPGQLDYGSAGTGSAIHLAGVLFTSEAGVDMKHVPYRGTGPLINDLVAGHVKLGFSALSAVYSQIEAGKLKALAVTTPIRAPILPNVPSMAEAGLPGYSFEVWVAMIAPKALPPATVDLLYQEIKASLATDSMKADLAAQATTPVAMDPEASQAFIASELVKHQRLVVASGAKAE